jgi:hypothetical protein
VLNKFLDGIFAQNQFCPDLFDLSTIKEVSDESN